MTEKRSFSDDWSALTYEQVLEAVQYLSMHYKEYEITQSNKNAIYIDNVCLLKGRLKDRAFVSINGKYYADSISNFDVWVILGKLFDKCEQEVKTRKYINKGIKKAEHHKKLKKWWKDNQFGFLFFFSFAVLGSSLVGAAYYELDKKDKIESKVKEYEKTLPNYKEYQQVKSQITQYRDSLLENIK